MTKLTELFAPKPPAAGYAATLPYTLTQPTQAPAAKNPDGEADPDAPSDTGEASAADQDKPRSADAA